MLRRSLLVVLCCVALVALTAASTLTAAGAKPASSGASSSSSKTVRRGSGKPEAPTTDLTSLNLKPTLPGASGQRKATKLIYVMGNDEVIWSGAVKTMKSLSSQQSLAPTAYSLAFVTAPDRGKPENGGFGSALWFVGDNPGGTPSTLAK